MRKIQKKIRESLKEFLRIFGLSAAVFIFTNLFVGELMVISGSSMEPSFQNNERILSEKISYHFTKPKRGQIIVVKHPKIENRLLIKRIVGLPGETILISQNQIFINMGKLDEPYLPTGTNTEGANAIATNVEFKIPSNSYVVLGDNRDDSEDSRKWGAIEEKNIIGKAILVYYPLDKVRVVNL